MLNELCDVCRVGHIATRDFIKREFPQYAHELEEMGLWWALHLVLVETQFNPAKQMKRVKEFAEYAGIKVLDTNSILERLADKIGETID